MLMHVCHLFRHFTPSFGYTVNMICRVGKDVSDEQGICSLSPARQIKLLLNVLLHIKQPCLYIG